MVMLTLEIPSWYFQQEELISAAETEVSNAWDFYHTELNNLQDKVTEIDSQEFSEAETRLAEAQASFEGTRISEIIGGIVP